LQFTPEQGERVVAKQVPKKQARVLVAEDNPEGAELLQAYLSETDYDVEIVPDGEETLRKVREWHPDVLLLDVMMPKISGFEVCKQIKADPATRDIVVLMVTALDQPSDVDRAVAAGTNDFFTKPVNKTELLLRVRAALSSRLFPNPIVQALSYMEGVAKGE
jgi:two-component system, OmpR family, alkaline phosphatase synthesis response regulator PhoP